MIFNVSYWHRIVSERIWLLGSMRPVLRDRSFVLFAVFSVALVALIVALDVGAGLAKYHGLISDSTTQILRLSNDGSIGEMAGHILLQTATLLTGYVAIRLGSMLHGCVAAILQFLVVDDVLQFHERAGPYVGARFFPNSTIAEPHVMGELGIGLILGVGALALIAMAYRRSSVWQGVLCLLVVAPVMLIGVFGVGVDFLHAVLPQDNKFWSGIAALLEDGGELFSMALAMLGALAGYLRYDAAPVASDDSLRWSYQLATLRDSGVSR